MTDHILKLKLKLKKKDNKTNRECEKEKEKVNFIKIVSTLLNLKKYMKLQNKKTT